MVGVVGSSPIAPTNHKPKQLIDLLGLFVLLLLPSRMGGKVVTKDRLLLLLTITLAGLVTRSTSSATGFGISG